MDENRELPQTGSGSRDHPDVPAPHPVGDHAPAREGPPVTRTSSWTPAFAGMTGDGSEPVIVFPGPIPSFPRYAGHDGFPVHAVSQARSAMGSPYSQP